MITETYGCENTDFTTQTLRDHAQQPTVYAIMAGRTPPGWAGLRWAGRHARRGCAGLGGTPGGAALGWAARPAGLGGAARPAGPLAMIR
jgi:hypothetical protein